LKAASPRPPINTPMQLSFLATTYRISRSPVVALAEEFHLPAIYLFRQFAPGGLVVYGPQLPDCFAVQPHVDKNTQRSQAFPSPVERPTKCELVIDRKNAKALGLTVRALVTRERSTR